jgi:hypothetical protein
MVGFYCLTTMERNGQCRGGGVGKGGGILNIFLYLSMIYFI